MNGIRNVVTDIITKLKAIQFVNQDSQTVNLYSALWNNQLENLLQGEAIVFPRPAAFVEVVPFSLQTIGLSVRSGDITLRIHLIHDFYNEDGTYDQDLEIFDLRDMVLANYDNPVNPGLSGFCPTGCSSLACGPETPDMNHGNLTHYILDFSCNFVDSKASPYDVNANRIIDTADPDMDLNTVKNGIPNNQSTNVFVIPQK